MKRQIISYEKTKRYRGYLLKWRGTETGHWLIYDDHYNFLGSADDNELDERLDEIESEG